MVWKNDQVSEAETNRILELARDALRYPGDIVELGCYKGDTSLFLAEILKGSGKKLWIYDSFEGLPAKTRTDESELGKGFQEGVLVASKREVKERFLRANLPVPIIKKAWFNELESEDLPDEISLAFLDGDLYESIRDSLKLVEGRMVDGGVIIIHDYNNPALPGVAKAVDEWLDGEKIDRFESLAIIRK